MTVELEDARKLAHGTYDDVIVAEHRSAGSAPTPYVVLELPERSRVVDKGPQYEVDGVVSPQPPTVGGSYRLIIAPATSDATPGGSLRYETMNR